MELDLPPPYASRPYAGAADHAAMLEALTDYRAHVGNPFTSTLAQFDVQLANLVNCDPARDVAVIEDAAGTVVGFLHTAWKDRERGGRDLEWWAAIRGAHLARDLYLAVLAGAERHTLPWAGDGDGDVRFFTWVMHPGPDRELTGESAWLESAGYSTIRFGAYLMRPDLDDIPELALPHGVEVRPVREDELRAIFDAHWEAFRGSFDHREPTEQDFIRFRDDPLRDVTLWKIAWAGDTIVGQVKTFVDEEANARDGCKRGWTENIATHADWRNRGIAGALLAMSLRELRDRGYEQAALGVDTQNPGGAFQLYTKLGFALHGYEAIYAKPVRDG